jgi:hypothetical protein
MFNFQSISVKGPAIGGNAGEVANIDLTVTAGVAIAVGEVVALPIITAAGTGQGAYGYIPTTGSAVLATQAMMEQSGRRLFGVALAAAANGSLVTVRVRGVCKASVTAASDITYGGGTLTVLSTAGTLGIMTSAAAGVDSQSGVALPLESTGTSNAQKYVLFDGINGFASISEA